MLRVLIAFFAALTIHMLLGVLPWSQERLILPQPTGNETITIDLTPVRAVAKKIPPRLTKQNERSQTPSLQQEQVKKSSPSAMSLPETNSPRNPVAEPVRHIRKATVAKVVASREKKAAQQIQQAAPPLSRRPVASILPTIPGESQLTDQIAPGASPALIKARPLYDQNPKPPYPNLARKRGWQGVVILAVRVLEDGSPSQLTIQTSSGHELLDTTAMKTVKQWHFLPGTKNNIPTPMEVLVPVHFLLH